ncbi:hypothetical protein KFL_000590350 [Klebsormidium nitens]|uniref:F-box domain-containing protein n=1 Tax=Klebsormidium nitens TaxID=105231 RepID=A0A1Y1HS88_KLENI|nr:hypothetical protein KFL_000590350 [Klebsormidium nitens]|eukprot:GAQ80682.1 hypothetical protein KFL_000590350 [Klebsormidium nitens]
MEYLDAPTFDHLLGFLAPEHACKLAVQSKALNELVGDSLLWKTWCEEDSPSLKTSPARELVAARYAAAVCARGARATYKQLFTKLAEKRSGLLNAEARSCTCKSETPLNMELSAYVMLMDVYVAGRGLLFCSTECAVSDYGCQPAGCQPAWKQTVRNVCKADMNGMHATEAEGDLNSALQQIPSGNDGVPEDWFESRRLPLHEQGNVHFSWKLMRKADGKIQILLDRKPVRSRHDSGFRRTDKYDDPGPATCESSFQAASALRDGSGTEWTTFQALMRSLLDEMTMNTAGGFICAANSK